MKIRLNPLEACAIIHQERFAHNGGRCTMSLMTWTIVFVTVITIVATALTMVLLLLAAPSPLT
jgi:hypothetical protein